MFKDLPVGATFHFDHSTLETHSGLAHGPWMKTGPRTYRASWDLEGLPGKSNPGNRVGSVRVKVRTDGSCRGR